MKTKSRGKRGCYQNKKPRQARLTDVWNPSNGLPAVF